MANLGRPGCARCGGSGWVPGQPKIMEASGGRRVEYPTTAPCPCRSTPVAQPAGPAPTDDHQKKAAGDNG